MHGSEQGESCEADLPVTTPQEWIQLKVKILFSSQYRLGAVH